MSSITWLDETLGMEILCTALARTLAHFLWQGTLITSLAFVLTETLRGLSARSKYMIGMIAMLLMAIAMPVTFYSLPPTASSQSQIKASGVSVVSDSRSHVLPKTEDFDRLQNESLNLLAGAGGPEQSLESAMTTVAAVKTPQLSAVDSTRPDGQADGLVNRDSQGAASETSTKSAFLSMVSISIAVIYLLGAAIMLGRLFLGFWGGHRLRGDAVTVKDEDFLERISIQAKRMGMRVSPSVAYCQSITVPVVVGVLRPMILLPMVLVSGLSPDQLDSFVAHELAHIRRFDPFANLLQQVTKAICFFHPAVWVLSRRIDIERENASDDLVLAAGWRAVDYADAMVRMAELVNRSRLDNSEEDGTKWAAKTALAATGRHGSNFRKRIMRMLHPEPSRVRMSPIGVITLAILMTFIFLMPLGIRSWSPAATAQQIGDKPSDTQSTDVDDDNLLGQTIDNFRLLDPLSRPHQLSDFQNQPLVVVAFIGTECPLAKVYGSQLAKMSKRYANKKVSFIAIDSNEQDTPTELGHFAKRHDIEFTVLKDPGNRVADQFLAKRTPEVFLLDQQRRVRYRGRIDDQFGVGYARPKSTENYLANAIDDLLAGQEVQLTSTKPVGCHIARVQRPRPTGDVTYTNQISRIMQRRCVECHRESGIAPFALTAYEDVSAWSETICEVVQDRRMPPWHANPDHGDFINHAQMPETEKQLLEEWLANGVPEGAPKNLPTPREFPGGWTLGQPDLILTAPEPIAVPATGVISYRYVTIDPGFTDGKWIRASEVRPGVRSVVHHILVFIHPPGGDPVLKQFGVGFESAGAYVPGIAPMQTPEGVARYVPAGSELTFQIHYTPDGIERQDQSEIGLYFADESTVKRTMQSGLVLDWNFKIPPRDPDYRVEAAHRFSHDMLLYSLTPHMHYRGKSFRYEATYPNGSREILLDVPRYDFNWQNEYRFKQPRFMPEGTLLRCVAHFDNSAENLANPNPNITVGWGEQTWNEMMIGFFEGVYLNQDLSLPEPTIRPVDGGRYRGLFRFKPDRRVQTVNLASTFNEWNNVSDPMQDPDGDGIYEAEIDFPAGSHRYKFVIDGKYWTHDPASRILTGINHNSFFKTDP